MCWAHAMRKIDAELNKVEARKHRMELRNDIFKVKMTVDFFNGVNKFYKK